MGSDLPPELDDLPAEIPVFPLSGVLLLPHGQLPLNIFEPRYLSMVEDALKSHRIIGMIQPRGADNAHPALFETGCAGRIVNFSETNDGRYLVTLRGVARFRVRSELDQGRNGYRRVRADWADFSSDLETVSCLNLDRPRLRGLLESYFELHGLSCDWNAVESATDNKLITCLSMICPLDAGEKQALLEAACCKARADLFMTILDMAVRQSGALHTSCCHGSDSSLCH
ncbi:LON peptidase substrate-binding domain-containing protein [Micavibrio aeruginosavorus]|uniref:LON peptidase substrate-binding domain-containing protein n=1 Tax=Micavibrio aeruginosavorus TaxID=349221 RepID=UPI003F4A8767